MKIFKLFSLLSGLLALSTAPLPAEIMQVDVYWNPGLCTTTCAQMLASRYQQLPGVALITMNIQGGHAQLSWKTGFPLVYEDLNAATKDVGVRWRDMHVKVRGTLNFQQNTFTLTSIGDNTVFTLIGPPVLQPGQTTLNYTLSNRQLSPDMIQKLSEALQKNWVAVIDGALFMPWRYTNYLVINTIQFIPTQPAVIAPAQVNPAQTSSPPRPLAPPQPAYPSR